MMFIGLGLWLIQLDFVRWKQMWAAIQSAVSFATKIARSWNFQICFFWNNPGRVARSTNQELQQLERELDENRIFQSLQRIVALVDVLACANFFEIKMILVLGLSWKRVWIWNIADRALNYKYRYKEVLKLQLSAEGGLYSKRYCTSFHVWKRVVYCHQ